MAKKKKRGKASLSTLKTGTHTGRDPQRNPNSANVKLTVAKLSTGMTPTPHGPEPHWPAG